MRINWYESRGSASFSPDPPENSWEVGELNRTCLSTESATGVEGGLRKRKKFNKYEIILNHCRNKNVLDIGCAGQDLNYEDPLWLHGQIAKVAKNITGIDIDTDSVNKLKSLGYRVLLPREIDTLEKEFDVIIMADVIEHVENPVGFLSNYAPYLASDGIIIITTPNAKRANDYINILWGNNFWLNEEHTMWLCPYTMSEIVRRANLKITGFYWLQNYKTTCQTFHLKASLINACSNFLSFIRPMFNANFMVIIKK